MSRLPGPFYRSGTPPVANGNNAAKPETPAPLASIGPREDKARQEAAAAVVGLMNRHQNERQRLTVEHDRKVEAAREADARDAEASTKRKA